MANTLKEVAENKKKKILETDDSEDISVTIQDNANEEDVVINVGEILDSPAEYKDNNPSSKMDDIVESTSVSSIVSEDDLRAVMPDLSDDAFITASKETIQKLATFKKNLIIKNGFTPEEANEAVTNRLANIGKEINDDYINNNPKLGVIEIDKKNIDTISFTDEEKSKLQKVKAIKLIAVEDQELKSIKIDKIDKKNKSTFIRSVEGSLSRYSVPVPLLGDYLTFNGAQIIQLMSTVKYDDEGVDELLAKKASLLYSCLSHGSNMIKTGDNGDVILSYSDFINKYNFHDMDIGLYAILVASSMEESESQFKCPACGHSFQFKYNLKTLMKSDNIPDKFKKSFDDILTHKYDNDFLKEMCDEYNKVLRFKSPYSNNIYDVAYPSIARAIRVYASIDQKDNTMVYLSAFGLFINSMYIYNKKSDSYIQIESDEIKLLMETLQSIPQRDIDIIYQEIKKMLYSPKFVLESKCPQCGNNMNNELTIDELVFLMAQDSFAEMR